MDAYQILVISLSIMLAFLLVLAAIFLFVLIKLVRQVRQITDKAEHVIEGVESVSDIVKGATTSLAIGRFITTIAKSFNKRTRRRTGRQ